MKKNILKLGMVLSVALMTACETADKDKEWGNSLLYMPQAVLTDGGISNNHTVLLSNNSQDTSIVVGLYRSGLEALKSVTVDLIVDADSLNNAINMANQPEASSVYEIYKTAKLLPEAYYTVPDKISLTDGQRENHVELIIHKQQLLNDGYLNTIDNRFILPLRIINPTRYEINKSISLTMFIFELK